MRKIQDIKQKREVTREISYSHSAETRSGRVLIRAMENATGRLNLIKRASGYEKDVAQGHDFWKVMTERYGLSLNVVRGSLDYIPRSGPLILIANHPYGILDGLMMGNMLSEARDGDFRILAHRVFRKAEEINRVILPVAFEETREAVQINLKTRKDSLAYLEQGGAIGIFPGGTVSTSAKPFSAPMDPVWRSFTARMVAKSNATVLPIFFTGHNSRFFQVASHLHYTLRMGLLIKEFKSRVNKPVDVVIGKPIAPEMLDPFRKDGKAMMDFLRSATYQLSPTPMRDMGYGFEFENRHKN